MAIVKRYEDLTLADKIYYLHTFFPQDIKAFLLYCIDHIAQLLERPEKINIEGGINDGPAWPDVLAALSEHIDNNFDELVESPFYFVGVFSKGKNQFFFLDCIKSYLLYSTNNHFKKAIQFLFDC